MDPSDLIREQRQTRQEKELRRIKKADYAPNQSYYAGQDSTTGQPLKRDSGGNAIPAKGLSNIQPDIGQQGRGALRSFDIGGRRSPAAISRRKAKGDGEILYLSYEASTAFTDFYVYSEKRGEKRFAYAITGTYSWGIFDPQGLNRDEDIKIYVTKETNLGGEEGIIENVNYTTGAISTQLNIAQEPNVKPRIHGLGVQFISDAAFAMSYRRQLGQETDAAMDGLIYPSLYPDPVPVELDNQELGDSILIQNSLNTIVSGSPINKIYMTGYNVQNGVKQLPRAVDLRGYHAAFLGRTELVTNNSDQVDITGPLDIPTLTGVSAFGNINILLYKPNPQASMGYIESDLMNSSNDLNYSNSRNLLLTMNYATIKFSKRGDINLIQWPITRDTTRWRNTVTISRLGILPSGEKSGLLGVLEEKQIDIPSQVKDVIVAVWVPQAELFDTGRGVNP